MRLAWACDEANRKLRFITFGNCFFPSFGQSSDGSNFRRLAHLSTYLSKLNAEPSAVFDHGNCTDTEKTAETNFLSLRLSKGDFQLRWKLHQWTIKTLHTWQSRHQEHRFDHSQWQQTMKKIPKNICAISEASFDVIWDFIILMEGAQFSLEFQMCGSPESILRTHIRSLMREKEFNALEKYQISCLLPLPSSLPLFFRLPRFPVSKRMHRNQTFRSLTFSERH